MTYNELYEIAVNTLNPRELSGNSSAGSVAAALLTDGGNVYTGVCIDTPCSMGFCAEHAAAAAMITAGESRVVKMIAVYQDKKVVPPCGRCREFICQLDERNEACEVYIEENKSIPLSELLPHRWK